ncbi:MAG TPA: CHAT domain-containing tetratricopeptide repeat protein [Gemmataceae bacterium]|nr:CHAT domain-containing tetratricopeptide repeat protein [Gemmataceae bacterium]
MRTPLTVRKTASYLTALLVALGLAATDLAPAWGEQPKALTAAQKKRLQERDRLEQQAKRLAEAGNLDELLPVLEKQLAIAREVFGEAHEEVSFSFWRLAWLHELRENFAAARKAREQVLAIDRKLHGAKDWRVTNARLALEDTDRLSKLDVHSRGQLALASRLHQRLLRLRKEGRAKEGLALGKKVLEIRARILGRKHPDYANSLEALAGLYHSMGDHANAEVIYQQAMLITQQGMGENHPAYATSLNNLGALYRSKGNYAKAEPLYGRAVEIYRETLGDNHRAYATAVDNLAVLYRETGDYAKALPLARRALEIRKRALRENHPEYATSLNNLAVLYNEMGDYARAEPMYRQALVITKQALGEKHPDYANSLINLAALYTSVGDYAKAVSLFRRAIEICRQTGGEEHPEYASSLTGLAWLYVQTGEYSKALPLAGQAVEIRKHALGEKHPDYARSLDLLAGLYGLMGDKAKALLLSRRALEIRRQALREDHPDYAAGLNNVALCYWSMGNYGEAASLSRRAAEIFKEALGEKHPEYATSLKNLAGHYWSTDQQEKASSCLEHALTVQQAFLDNTFSAMSERQRLDCLTELQSILHLYLSVGPEVHVPATRIYRAVLGVKGAVAARQADERVARDRPELRPRVEKLRQARAALAHWARTPPAISQQRADWLQRFGELERQKEELEGELARKSDRYRRFRELRKATAEQVAQALPPRTVLIDFVQFTHIDFVQFAHFTARTEHKRQFRVESRVLAFVLGNGREAVCVDVGPAELIDRAVGQWRQAIARGTSPAAAGTTLYRLVWKPLQPHLAGVDGVLVAPDGPLWGLPFAALPGEKANSYLIEDLAIGYITSGRHLLELAADASRATGQGLLAVGGLEYGEPPGSDEQAGVPAYLRKPLWKILPGTRLEVNRLGRSFHAAFPKETGPRLLSGSDASAGRLKRELPPAKGAHPWRYLHIASHGFFEEPAPQPAALRRADGLLEFLAGTRQDLTYGRNPLLLSGIVLSGANRSPEQGILTAEEVSGLDLRGTELVVLSACETGLGKVAGGEGVLGLQRAFQAAEARTLVTSLWSVNDAATSVLMEEFYANLWQKKMTKLEALRQAQLTVLRHPEKVGERAKELRGVLAKRGVSEEALAKRGIGKEAVELPESGRVRAERKRSQPAWWAAFVLSGDGR